MMELFDGAKLETSADTRAKAVRALGFDEPPATEKLSRSSFSSDEEYIHACTELSLRNHSPEYRQEYERLRRQYTGQLEAERQDQEEQKRRQELAQAIKDCVLRPEEQQRVDDEARSRAQADLAAGRISYQQLGAAVAGYAERLTQEKKESKVHSADLNRQIRAAMAQARGRNRT